MKRIIGAYNRTLRWYRSLGKGKWIAWVVVVVVAIALVVAVAASWLLSAKYRRQIAELRQNEVIGEAREGIAVAKGKSEFLEAARDAALGREKVLAGEEAKVDKTIAAIDEGHDRKKKKVKGQTHEEQSDFFNNRYRG